MSLATINKDMTQPKPTTIQEQKVLKPNGNKLEAQSQQVQQTESSSDSKKLMDTISDSVGVDRSMAHISFSKDDSTGDIVIKIIDNKTDEVIKQIPSEAIVELRKRLNDLQGLFLDKKA
ncbi:MAG: flagellar protein FlaG [Candidatus Poribacteria bacterium]|nr:flagellar protein FlaG [Candidatus Poribacteria bacterium]MDQ1329142.1 flagellar protein FlaG [Candidatus Poribacteria bacterium]